MCLNGIAVGMLLRDPAYLEGSSPGVTPGIPTDPEEIPLTEREPLVPSKGQKKWTKIIWEKFGLHLLGNWMFVVYLISTAASILSQDSQHWFIPDRAIEIGFSEYSAAMTLTVANFANIFSRLVFWY